MWQSCTENRVSQYCKILVLLNFWLDAVFSQNVNTQKEKKIRTTLLSYLMFLKDVGFCNWCIKSWRCSLAQVTDHRFVWLLQNCIVAYKLILFLVWNNSSMLDGILRPWRCLASFRCLWVKIKCGSRLFVGQVAERESEHWTAMLLQSFVMIFGSEGQTGFLTSLQLTTFTLKQSEGVMSAFLWA